MKASEDLKIVGGVKSSEGLKSVMEGGRGLAFPLYYSHECGVGGVKEGTASEDLKSVGGGGMVLRLLSRDC